MHLLSETVCFIILGAAMVYPRHAAPSEVSQTQKCQTQKKAKRLQMRTCRFIEAVVAASHPLCTP